MAESLKLSGPVTVEPTSKELIAFKLMEKIANHETTKPDEESKRAYWLTLYRQCYKAADGYALSDILETK